MNWWPFPFKQVETVTGGGVPKPEPPQWFIKVYGVYLQSEEGQRLYGPQTKSK